MYIIQSSYDDKQFYVDEIVMKSSTLLKNLCEITLITEPIKVACSSQYLELFIRIVQKKNHEFLSGVSDQSLAEICKEMCILDSDAVLNVIAKEILQRIEELKWDKMMEYFGLEDDFSAEEHKLIDDRDRVEYFISMDTDAMKFPLFSETSFSSMNNKFYTPLNALLARVIQLSHGKTAFELSKINKAMKNESDRYPVKLERFTAGGQNWCLNIGNYFTLDDQKYFGHIKKRKLIVKSKIMLVSYGDPLCVSQCSSFNFIIPANLNPPGIIFQKSEEAIYYFNVKDCPFPSIRFEFTAISVNFDNVYEHLIAKDITKEIEFVLIGLPQIEMPKLKKFFRIVSSHAFNFFAYGEYVHIYKMPNKSKFHEIRINTGPEDTMSSNFIDFLKKYMCDDGVIYSRERIFEIPHAINYNPDIRCDERHTYLISDIKRNLKIS